MRTELRPGVGAVIHDGAGRILLHRRRSGGNGWAPISGRIEVGESVQDAVMREIQEETRLSVRIDFLVGVYSDPTFQTVEYQNHNRIQFVTCVFACTALDHTFHGCSKEAEAWGWFDASNLPPDLLPYARIWLEDALASAPGTGPGCWVR